MFFGLIVFVFFSVLFYYPIFKFIKNKNNVSIDLNNTNDIKLLSYATTNILFNHIKTFQLIEDIYNSQLLFIKGISCAMAIETIKRDFNINSNNLYDLDKDYEKDIYLKFYHLINDFYEHQHIIKHSLKQRIINHELIRKDFKGLILLKFYDFYSKHYKGDESKYIKYFIDESIKVFNECEEDIYIEYEKLKYSYF